MDESLQEIKNQIQKLKKERNAVILAHYYVPGEVQDIADFVGDSYYLSKIAASAKEDVILFCGVRKALEHAKPPKCFEGLPITLVAAALTSMTFMGFAGMADKLFG